MDRLSSVEREIDILREKFKCVEELQNRVNNLENWITSNVGWGLGSLSSYRGLILPQAPSSGPLDFEPEYFVPSGVVITKVQREEGEAMMMDPHIKPFSCSEERQSDDQSVVRSGVPEKANGNSMGENKDPVSNQVSKEQVSSTCDDVKTGVGNGNQEQRIPEIKNSSANIKNEFKCAKCGASFFNLESYAQHKLKHKRFDCRLCTRKFQEHFHLLQHVQAVHHSNDQSSEVQKKSTRSSSSRRKSRGDKGVASVPPNKAQRTAPVNGYNGNPMNANQSHSGNSGSSGQMRMEAIPQPLPQASGSTRAIYNGCAQGGTTTMPSTVASDRPQNVHSFQHCASNFTQFEGDSGKRARSQEGISNQSFAGGRSSFTRPIL